MTAMDGGNACERLDAGVAHAIKKLLSQTGNNPQAHVQIFTLMSNFRAYPPD